jgi:hypothetical protein
VDEHAESQSGGEAIDVELASGCGNCDGRTEWESLVDDDGEERWFSICSCGQMATFLPEQPHVKPKDPLRAYLRGLARPILPETPPWIRLFLNTIQQPCPIRWRYAWQSCPHCQTAVRMGMQACPRAGVFAVCSLCLSCGYVTTSYKLPRRVTPFELSGTEWAPACPAVQRLRDCALRPHAALRTDGWSYSGGDWSDWIPNP